MRAKFTTIFALLATTALTASITEQSLKALSDATATKPASQDLPKGAIKADFGFYGYNICDEAITARYFRKVEFRLSMRPKLGVGFLIYFDTVANQQVTILGLQINAKYGVIPVLSTDYYFENPHTVPAGEPFQITEQVPPLSFATGRFEGRARVITPSGQEVGCLDFWYIMSA